MRIIQCLCLSWLVVMPAMSFSQVFISEYIEGSSSNKAIEIYNPGPDPVDLTALLLERYNNGSLVVIDSFLLSDSGLTTLAAGEVFVVANPSANVAILDQADTTSTLAFFNGDDAITLKQNGVIVDVIGEVGVDPGAGWPVDTGATNNFTLVRMNSICHGGTDWNEVVNEWNVFPIDTVTDLGMHNPDCNLPVFISEYIEGSSSNKAIEIYNPGPDPVNLTALLLERYNNGSLVVTDSFLLSDSGLTTLAAGEVFVIANPSANVAIMDQADATSTLAFFNGDDAVTLKQNGVIVDVIGEVGVDPGAGWPVDTGATNNFTLVRMNSICHGGTDWNEVVNEWNVFPIDTVTDLGMHKPDCNLPVFISEYIEGSSSNKAIEIYNPGPAPVNLTALLLERYNNGSLVVTDSFLLSDSGLTTLAAGEVFVVANPSANVAIMDQADTTSTLTFFNGDDAVTLKQDGVIVDVIGEVGVDPGTGWPVDTGATNNFTLVRMNSICQGGTDWDVVVNEWDVFPIDTVDDLGMHTYICIRTYLIGGSVTGLLEGNMLTIQNNNTDDLEIIQNGPFVFSTPLNIQSNYVVTVDTQPMSPNQTCTLSNENGQIEGNDIIDIGISCDNLDLIYKNGFEEIPPPP